ncbi:MAG: hypothetical protein AAFU73_12985 [Planctomycetota bacterium]
MSSRTHRLASLALFAFALLVAAPTATAQTPKVEKDWTDVSHEGFRFKSLTKYKQVPTGSGFPDELVSRFESEAQLLFIFAVEQIASLSGAEEDEAKEDDEPRERRKRQRRFEVFPVLERQPFLKGLGSLEGEATFEETLKIDGLRVRHQRFQWEVEDAALDGTDRTKVQPRTLEIFTYPLKHAEIYLVYTVVKDEFDKKWERTILKSAKSFEQVERVAQKEIDVSGLDFDSQLAWAEQEASKTDGWRAIGTDSKRFVLLVHNDDKRFLKALVKRLEVSRDIYEKDFPPPPSFDAVSIVRVCKDRAEFQSFGGVGGGTAGYFSPSSAELVLFDAKDVDRNTTFAVASHEAFHQYCHFLFNESEAHRWFDEGHGDYYGGLKVQGKRGKITPKMPAGLDRVGVIRMMVRTGQYKPVWEHLNYSHREWQTQGPMSESWGGVACYSQSWSIVYMLRQGMLGKLGKSHWEDEWADIIPNYVTTLSQGFSDAYAEILKEREEAAAEAGEELSEKDRKINRFMLDPRQKDEIWEKAIAASWGKVDMDLFTEKWLAFVEKGI